MEKLNEQIIIFNLKFMTAINFRKWWKKKRRQQQQQKKIDNKIWIYATSFLFLSYGRVRTQTFPSLCYFIGLRVVSDTQKKSNKKKFFLFRFLMMFKIIEFLFLCDFWWSKLLNNTQFNGLENIVRKKEKIFMVKLFLALNYCLVFGFLRLFRFWEDHWTWSIFFGNLCRS